MTTFNNRDNLTIKNAIALIAVIVLFSVGFAFISYYQTHYRMDAIVIGVEDNKVLVEDNTNNLWEFEGDGYTLNEMVQVTFWTKGTDTTREDDEIIRVKKLDKSF